jgi:CelD/BcsL family acetyltransferase involved in cellulose biosynthesis
MRAFDACEAPVVEISERSSFVALEAEWNALVDAVRPEPFYRHEFIRVWLDNFAPNKRWVILSTRDPSGRLAAVLPLIAGESSMFGVPLRQLSGASNVHSCRFDLIARDPQAAGRAFFQHLAASDRWDVIQLMDVPEQGGAWEILGAARRAGYPVGIWESMRSPYIPLDRSWQLLEGQLSPKFLANLHRRRRHLQQRGTVTLERISGGPVLERSIEEGFWLEQEGWKGTAGTAIAQDGSVRGFYSELAKASAHRRNLACHFLRLDGEPVSFHYALELAGRYFLLKPAYSERLKELGPGHLLVYEVLCDCIQRGLKEFDFLGPDMPWKRDWTLKTRSHTWLFVFRDSTFGRALCRAKFRWMPAARRVMQ